MRNFALRCLLAAFLVAAIVPLPGKNAGQNAAFAGETDSPTPDRPKQTALPPLENIVEAARKKEPGALADYCSWMKLAKIPSDETDAATAEPAILEEIAALGTDPAFQELDRFGRFVAQAQSYADDALAHIKYDRREFHRLIEKILSADTQSGAYTLEAIELASAAWRRAETLVRTRDALLAQYQDEARRGGAPVGTRLAWSMIRLGGADPDTRLDLASFRHDRDSAEIRLRHRGEDVHVSMDESDDKRRVRATVGGYAFNTGWSVLLQKPIGWMADTAARLRAAGVSPEDYSEWEIMEAPEGLIALAGTDAALGFEVPRAAFFNNELRAVEAVPMPADSDRLKEEFRAAAEALHAGVMADESIPRQLRMALEPILAGTYREIDARDYFDGDFCRRLIEANYLEAHVNPLPPERAAELERYRRTLANIEAGIDRFAVDLGADGTLFAVSRPDLDVSGGNGDDVRDPETGETLSRYHWRWERGDRTVFHSPLPARYLYAMSVAEEFPGRHSARPAGVPARTEVWHALLGRLAWYEDGAENARGDAEKWLRAVVLDAHGRRDPNAGPLGWNFPLFVPVRDDQGDPVLIATKNGVVPGPDFSGVEDEAARRAAQDEWLDNAAAILTTPGEMSLIYQVFFRYCSDSPLPELPNLIGSHLALSDTHQTVHQSLDRRWVGRLIGDCDDLAEFFQNLAARQGRLVHVMQLPAHAAAGWLDENPDGGFEFIVLQTGPVLRFTADTRVAAVEKAYRHFENEIGESQFTSSAVPLLLRFANEDTRTPFVLSARIYWDREYAEAMITVQEYWHLHAFSAAIERMEEMIASDRDPGNIKELASLYEQVGEFARAAALREEELATAGDDELAALSTLMDMARLHVRARDGDAALAALEKMRGRLDALRVSDPALYARALSFRAAWAALLSRLGEPERAWSLVRHDVEEAAKNQWRVSEPLMRILTTVYDRMSIQRDLGLEDESRQSARIRFAVRNALSQTFGKGYFKKDDSFNKIHSRYFWLGRYGVAAAGRKAGLDSLCLDGPYPSEPRNHAAREEDLSEADWEWFRVMPRLYLGFGMEMLDREEYPELYDPVMARRVLECVARAAEKGEESGAGGLLGRDAVMQSALALAFIDKDLAAFSALMDQVRGKDYSSLYDDAAVLFGSYCGLVPLSEFAPWVEAFHTYFPGRQNYFKAAYRAMNKGHFRHAVQLARATAGFFPDEPLLVAEAEALERYAEALHDMWLEKGWDNRDWTLRRREESIATWRRDMVSVVE